MLTQIFLFLSWIILTSPSLLSSTVNTTLATSMLRHSEAGDSQVTVKGTLDESVRLPCHVDQDNCGDVYFITWTKYEKDDRWSRIYLYADNVEKPLRDLAGRAKFSIQRNEAHLTINKLKNNDESLYKCDVTYVAGKCPSLTFTQLKIIAKPTQVSIEYNNSLIISGNTIRANEKDRLRLTCIVRDGKPAPRVSWRRIDKDGNRKIILTKNSSSSENMMNVTLDVELNRSDLNTRYECHVEHDSIKNDSMDASVHIDLIVGASAMEIVGPQDAVKEGDILVLQCIVYDSKPEVQITWRNGSKTLETNVKGDVDRNLDSTVTTRSYIQLPVSRFDHLASIECQAINPAMKKSISQSIELRIQFAPIVVMEPQNELIVNESVDMVNIYCTFSCNPADLIENETVWFKGGKELEISNDSSHYISHHSGYPILTIVEPTRKDIGTYSCSVSNAIGRGIAEIGVHLTVLYPPSVNLQIYPSTSQGFTTKEGDDVRMICEVTDGNPLNVTRVKWMKNEGELMNETTQKEVVWLDVQRSMTGNYSCVALSAAGWSDVSNTIEIDVNYTPGRALVTQINGMYAIKGENLFLECLVQDLGRPIATEYYWEHNDVVLSNQRDAVLHISDLKLINKGNVSCAAVNAVGMGEKGYFTIDPFSRPQIIDSLPPKSGTTLNATHHSISCRIECYPICNVTWMRNDQPIENGSHSYTIKNSIHPEERLLNRFVSVVSTLIWNMTALATLDRTRDSNVKYSCVSSGNVVGEAVESHTRFFVEYPPENLRIKPRRVDVMEGQIPPEIFCESDALPQPSYRWQSVSNPDKHVGVIASTQTLSFNRSIERDRSGTYSCIASNRHGQANIDLTINVLYAPTCTIYESRSGKDDQDVVVICEVLSANPTSDLIFTWQLNNQTINDTLIASLAIQEGVKSKIVIPSSDHHLFGKWSCSVSNSVGQTIPNCTLFVSAPIAADWTPLNDESIIIISAVLAGLILTFLVILLILICLMKRHRQKQEDANQVSQTREKPDGSRSPTPSSAVNCQLPSNQVITYKKVEINSKLKRNDNIIDVNQQNKVTNSAPQIVENVLSQHHIIESSNAHKEMYENMNFHRNRKKCLMLTGALMPAYQRNIAQLTKELSLRRTQSARYYNKQTNDDNIYSVERNVIYADLQLTPNQQHQQKNIEMNGDQTSSDNERINDQHANSKSHCEYAVLRFENTPSPPSIC